MNNTATAFDVLAKYPSDQIQRSCDERLQQLRTAQSNEEVTHHYHQGKGYLQALSDAALITRQEEGIISCQLLETMLLAMKRLNDTGGQ